MHAFLELMATNAENDFGNFGMKSTNLGAIFMVDIYNKSDTGDDKLGFTEFGGEPRHLRDHLRQRHA